MENNRGSSHRGSHHRVWENFPPFQSNVWQNSFAPSMGYGYQVPWNCYGGNSHQNQFSDTVQYESSYHSDTNPINTPLPGSNFQQGMYPNYHEYNNSSGPRNWNSQPDFHHDRNGMPETKGNDGKNNRDQKSQHEGFFDDALPNERSAREKDQSTLRSNNAPKKGDSSKWRRDQNEKGYFGTHPSHSSQGDDRGAHFSRGRPPLLNTPPRKFGNFRDNDTNKSFRPNQRGAYPNQGRGSYINRSPQGRGHSFGRRPRWDMPQENYMQEDENESNEINQWLQMSKDEGKSKEKEQSSSSKEPLPGSEEERTNDLKKKTDQIRLALKQKKTVNLNELLSSGDESKSENQASNKLKSFPKNLAELELDASDMRAIGRANTDKSNCISNELSDDDIIEIERPPSPPRLVINIDDSPQKSSSKESVDKSDNDKITSSGKAGYSPENVKQRKALVSVIESVLKGNNSKSPKILVPSPSRQRTPSRRTSESSMAGSDASHTFSSPPPVANQRRRRASSSSGPEPLSPNQSQNGVRSPLNQEQRSVNTNSSSSPFHSLSAHNLQQRKIINDLKKTSQSKLRDLINNRGSGKLEFAVRELMKEHRAFLSRESRDVAEKLIPAEILNPKPTDLPPDDSSLLADFAIDWSSLPGELINTLGDLFTGLESEDGNSDNSIAEKVSSSVENVSISGGYQAVDPALASDLDETTSSHRSGKGGFAGEDRQQSQNGAICSNFVPLAMEKQDFNVNLPKEGDDCSEALSSKTVNMNTARIRVCNFARQNNVDVTGLDSLLHQQLDNDDSRLNPDISHTTGSSHGELGTGGIISEHSMTTGVSVTSESLTLNHKRLLPSVNSLNSESELCEGQETVQNSQVISNINPEQIKKKEKVHPLKNRSDLPTRNEKSSEECINQLESVNNQSRMRISASSVHEVQQKYGHSETGLSEKQLVNNGKKNKVRGGKKKSKNKERKLVHLEERNWFEDSTLPDSLNSGGDMSDISRDNASHDLADPPVAPPAPPPEEVSNFGTVEKEGISMMPVLMMTVPAQVLADSAYNLTPTEMQKRIQEIDAQLQSLVHERFILYQALKAAQANELVSSTTGSGLSIENENRNSPLAPQGTCQSDLLSRRPEVSSSSKRKSDDDLSLLENVPLIEKHPKRFKLQEIESVSSSRDRNKKEDQRKKKENQKKKEEQNLVKDCFVRLEVLDPEKHEGTRATSTVGSKVITLDDDEKGSSKGSSNLDSDVSDLSQAPFATFLEDAEGTILDIKIDNPYVYAASQNGRVYRINHIDNLQVDLICGEKNTSGITCIEVFQKSLLYTGSVDGEFSIFDMKLPKDSKYILKPKSTHSIANGIHCLEAKWGFVYIGTKTGSVIPFHQRTETAGEPLNLGGYPVLSIKACMEGPRKVLVVASRSQPISIRDASSGLLLRSLGGCETVYSIELTRSWIFCGSNTNKISAFDFQSGDLKFQLPAGIGVVDIKFFEDVLFCACYDGNIYCFDIEERKLLSCFEGLGKMILCLDVCKRKIFCGSKDQPLTCFSFPPPVLKHLRMKKKRFKLQSVEMVREELATQGQEELAKKHKKKKSKSHKKERFESE